jgi:HPr kinase/phosphorylase
MPHRKTTTVKKFIDRARQHHLDLKLVTGRTHLSRTIGEPTVNRPGLALAGFLKHFPWRRLQTLGTAEIQYVKSLAREVRQQRYAALFAQRIPCLVICRHIRPDPDLVAAAQKARVPVLRSPLVTMKFINDATLVLEEIFAPEGSERGCMVDIQGIGVLIRGEPGIGKSECVLALIERGYALVSDDVVKVRLSEERRVIGTSPEAIREFMEVRGIGFINVPTLFGVRGHRTHKQIDLVVTLKEWNQVPEVERVGMETLHYDILGISLPHVVIPIRPGRDIARLVEVAALYIKHRLVGGNPAADLDRRTRSRMNPAPTPPPDSAAPGGPE